ncbi:hypothetical protein [Nocardia rhizosphaerihabitans]|nr:hypothetical protein [Nocardia rhizosphaerihabitans]
MRVTPHRLAKALTAEKLVTAGGLSAGALLEAVTEFQAILEHMATDQLDHTVVLLARALAEWDLRLGIPDGAAEQYRPVKNLAEVVLGSAFAYQLIRPSFGRPTRRDGSRQGPHVATGRTPVGMDPRNTAASSSSPTP